MKRFLKSFRHGQKGFTLVELLIVVAILGVLAALVIPNVGQFLESGNVAAGRAERSTLQVAVDGMMADAGKTVITAATGWQGEAAKVTLDGYDANDYLRRTPTKGTYDVDTAGVVTCTAYPGVSDLTRINS